MYKRDLAEVYPNLTKNLKIYVTLPKTNCEAERNFSKLSIKKSMNHARGKIELFFYSLYRKCYYKIVVIPRGNQRVCSQKMWVGRVL
jgi:hypothetical protein